MLSALHLIARFCSQISGKGCMNLSAVVIPVVFETPAFRGVHGSIWKDVICLHGDNGYWLYTPGRFIMAVFTLDDNIAIRYSP